MKTIKVSGVYTITVPLSNYKMRIDDETFNDLKELQEEENWEDLDWNIYLLLRDRCEDIISLGDDEFEGDSLVEFSDD
jgi:hypothetical protein